MNHPPTFDEFKAAAQFVRRPPSRHLFVKADNVLYSFTQQARGKLTAEPDTILRGIYDAYGVGKVNTFFADLDRDLRAVRAKT